jgi:hypothetical protein
VRFGEEITGTEVINPKNGLDLSLGEDVGFTDNFSLRYSILIA